MQYSHNIAVTRAALHHEADNQRMQRKLIEEWAEGLMKQSFIPFQVKRNDYMDKSILSMTLHIYTEETLIVHLQHLLSAVDDYHNGDIDRAELKERFIRELAGHGGLGNDL